MFDNKPFVYTQGKSVQIFDIVIKYIIDFFFKIYKKVQKNQFFACFRWGIGKKKRKFGFAFDPALQHIRLGCIHHKIVNR